MKNEELKQRIIPTLNKITFASEKADGLITKNNDLLSLCKNIQNEYPQVFYNKEKLSYFLVIYEFLHQHLTQSVFMTGITEYEHYFMQSDILTDYIYNEQLFFETVSKQVPLIIPSKINLEVIKNVVTYSTISDLAEAIGDSRSLKVSIKEDGKLICIIPKEDYEEPVISFIDYFNSPQELENFKNVSDFNVNGSVLTIEKDTTDPYITASIYPTMMRIQEKKKTLKNMYSNPIFCELNPHEDGTIVLIK